MRFYTLYIITLLTSLVASAQERTVENRPYCDLRPMHFGVIVGTHFQDLEFENVGPFTYTDADGNQQDALVTCDQNTWDSGFHVGVLGEMRMNDYFAFRVAPIMYFANRHIVFTNYKNLDSKGEYTQARQDMKSVYITCSFDLIYAAKRFNNHRPYVMTGIAPALNLSTKSNDYLQLKKSDIFFEVGMGCDFYLPFFKLRPELKFMYSLGNCLNTEHLKKLKDKNMTPYTGSVNSARSSIIALTFHFE